jgi:hypothetical protein
MRRIAAVSFGVACVLSLATPAGAAPNRYESSVVNVFWYYQEPLAVNAYRQTTWYVGVYEDSNGTFSDLYQDVSVCVRFSPQRIRCRTESYKVGYSELDRPGELYTIDRQGLTEAHLRGFYLLESFDESGNPTGSAEPTLITTDVLGVGDLSRSREKHTYHAGCEHYTTTTKGLSRDLEATGTLNGEDLGETYDGFMANNATLSHYHQC